MKTKTAIDYFAKGNPRKGRAALARALRISVAAPYQWGEWVPEVQAYRLREITGGALEIDSAAPYAIQELTNG